MVEVFIVSYGVTTVNGMYFLTNGLQQLLGIIHLDRVKKNWIRKRVTWIALHAEYKERFVKTLDGYFLACPGKSHKCDNENVRCSFKFQINGRNLWTNPKCLTTLIFY